MYRGSIRPEMNQASLQILSHMRMEMIGGCCISLSGSVEGLVQTLEDLHDSGKPRHLSILDLRIYQFTKRPFDTVFSTVGDHSCLSKQLLPS